jgi:hypothetical protein
MATAFKHVIPHRVEIIMRGALVVMLALTVAASGATAQTARRKPDPRAGSGAAPVAVDKRDAVIAGGAFAGKPYWLALARCGGIYFKLNALYTDVAVRARVVAPDPQVNAEYTRKLTDAIRIASIYYNSAERFLMTERGIERHDAMLTYGDQARAEGESVKTVEAGLAAAKACPVLYRTCQGAFPKLCSESLDDGAVPSN